MEYEILGIPENSSLDDAKKSLNQIRLTNHPDKLPVSEQLRGNIILRQAESAFMRIKKMKQVESLVSGIVPRTFRLFNIHNTDEVPHYGPLRGSVTIKNQDPYDSNISHTCTTYNYSNINGKVYEEGTINGRAMTKDELKAYRH